MKLVTFNIKNYKSVLELGNCEVNEKVTVLAGKNESGKTNILEGLFKLKAGEKFEEKEKTLGSEKYPEIEGTFKLDKNDIEQILNKLSSQYNSAFKQEQFDGLTRAHTISITRTQESYLVEGDSYSGILKIIKKDTQELIKKIDSLNEKFKAKGKDLLLESNSNITIKEQDGKSNIRRNVDNFIIRVQNYPTILSAAEVKGDIDEIKSLASKVDIDPTEEDIKKIFISHIPNFILFRSFDEEKIKDVMTFEEARNSQFIKDLTKISGGKLDIEEIIKKQQDDFWIQNLQEQFSASITKDFMDYWDPDKRDKINHVDIRIRVANSKISFFVSNPNTRQQLFPSQRSKGFQWFLSFYTRIQSNANSNEDNIILIDEPGLFLHAKAQESVLKVLNSLSKKDQIIYSTHSPYLFEDDKLERIRLVEKDKEDHSHIVNKFYNTKDQDALTPILTAIGHNIFSGIVFDEKKNTVILEGISDYLIINAMLKSLDFKQNNKIYFIPMKGANSIDKYVPFFIGWGLNFLVIVDNDDKGKEVKQELIEKWLMGDKQIIPISENSNESIEDLFTHEEYFKTLLNKEDYKGDVLISKQLNDSQKIIVAKKLQKELTNGSLILSEETKEKFNSLFKKIDDHFNG